MRIAYITPYYPPLTRGGLEVSLKLLAETLAKQRHQISVFVPNYKHQDEIQGKNPKVFRIKFGSDSVFLRTNPLSVHYFVKRILELGKSFDLIDAYSCFQPAKILSEKLKIPYICSIRDATPICDFRVDRNPRCYPFLEYFSKRFKTYGFSPRQVINAVYGYLLTNQNLEIITKASCLTFASGALARVFGNYNNCFEVINSIGLLPFKRQKINIPGINFKSDFVVLYAGRLSIGKGAGFLFEAAKKLITKNKNIKFVFIGEGELRSKISSSNNFGQIFCLGKKDHDFVLSLAEICQVTVVPSLIFEGFPRMAIESISLGTPAIGTKVGGIPEAVGKAGILVEPGNIQQLTDAIIKICSADEFYQQLRYQTKKQAENFSPKKITKRVLDVYEKVLAT